MPYPVAASRGRGSGGGAFAFVNAEAATWVAGMTGAPDDTRKGHLDTFVGSIKAISGGLGNFDVFYLMAMHDAQAARVNLITPGTFNSTAHASMVFLTDRHYVGIDSSAVFLDTGFSPVVGGFKYVLNSAHQGLFIRNNVTPVENEVQGNTSNLVARSATDTYRWRLNQGTTSASGAISTTSVGHTVSVRTASNAMAIFKDGVSVATATTVSSSLSNTLGVGRGTSQIMAFHCGNLLDAAQCLAIHDALVTYKTAVGA